MTKKKNESLERLKNMYEQAKLDGNKKLMKFYKDMLEKAKNEKKNH